MTKILISGSSPPVQREFHGKVGLVTGAASGIGRAAANAFAEEGACVVISDVDSAGAEETLRQISAKGGEALFVRADVSKSREVSDLVEQTVKKFGRLDFAYNNAGIEGKLSPTADVTEENWDRVMAVNLKGVWLCLKHEIPQMLKQGRGAIVNAASVTGIVGFRGLSAYAASKGGIIGLTKVAALEYAKSGIRVNAVCPGLIRTPMTMRRTGGSPKVEAELVGMEPIGRMGAPEEVAKAVVWLCSSRASFVTGQAIPVDGGWTSQ
ncbi:MAG: SDR family oxidoreductase [Candidatus Omnitrophica bacterium]|nr:SDR family oxidoreductase [Candidatus Omnitrophota bacterium]